MKKPDLGQTLTILANVGVIAGIIFLAYEIRQNTAAIQSSTVQDYIDGTIELMSDLATNSDLNDAWNAYMAGDESLSDADEVRALFMVRSQWFRYQGAFAQWQRGSMNASDWEIGRQQMCRRPTNDANGDLPDRVIDAAQVRRDTWHLHTPYLSDAFVGFIEQCWRQPADSIN
jgi:hypothetical protein